MRNGAYIHFLFQVGHNFSLFDLERPSNGYILVTLIQGQSVNVNVIMLFMSFKNNFRLGNNFTLLKLKSNVCVSAVTFYNEMNLHLFLKKIIKIIYELCYTLFSDEIN